MDRLNNNGMEKLLCGLLKKMQGGKYAK